MRDQGKKTEGLKRGWGKMKVNLCSYTAENIEESSVFTDVCRREALELD